MSSPSSRLGANIRYASCMWTCKVLTTMLVTLSTCMVSCCGRADQKPVLRTRNLLLGLRRSAQRWLALSICGNIVLAMLLAFKAEPKASTLACAPEPPRMLATARLRFASDDRELAVQSGALVQRACRPHTWDRHRCGEHKPTDAQLGCAY